MQCLDENALVALSEGMLDESGIGAIERHIDACPACAALVAEFIRLAGDGDAPDELDPHIGETVGPYEIVGWLGRGAMGRVYLAEDTRLERRVALKLVRDGGDEELRRRLHREAVAMAQLSHPNVVAVYDAGEGYVAMELVDGVPLSRLLRRRSTTWGWRPIVEMFVRAGRGLAAAHDAGIVHRDFKPQNVLVRSDGQVKVGDFGLAIRAEHAGGLPAGTPAYMAPELFEGAAADPRSDQFAFAVASWEALFGERPEAGIRAPAQRGDVPPAICAALVRALEPAPGDRHRSMGELLDALTAVLARSRRRWLAVAAAALGIVGIGFAVVASRGGPEVCPRPDARVAEVWSLTDRSATQRALAGVARSYAPELAPRIVAAVDGYTDRWIGAHQKTCRATHVRGEQSAALLDQRMRCLDRRLADLGALAERLAAADAGLVDRGLAAIAGLPNPDRCTGEARVERPPPSPEAAELFALASKVRAAELAGDRPEAAALARRGLARARELGDAHALAELGFLSGRLRAELGDIDEAERELVEAARSAREIGDESAVAGIWTELVHVVGIEKLAYDRAMVWAHAAEREIERLPPVPVLESRLLSTIASVHIVNGKAEEAERYHALALEAARPLEASDPLLYGNRLYNAGVFYRSQNRLDRAESLLSEALERFERELHPRHPTTAGARRELAKVAVARGDPVRAVDMFRGAIADLEAALGRDSPEVVASRMPLAAALARINKLDEAGRLAAEVVDSSADVHDRGAAHSILGRVARQRGDFDEALEHHRQAVALLQEGYGKADHPVVRSERMYVGIALTKLERHDEAIAIFEELVEGANEANRAPLHHNLAEALIDAGRCDSARPHLEAVIEIVEKQGGADHPNMAFPLVALAECARAAGRPAEAVDRLERALELRRGTGDVGVAEVLFELARSRWQSGDRAAAKRDAGEAVELLSGAEGTAPMIAEVRAWLAKRR